MAQKQLKPSDMAAVMAVIDPDQNTVGTISTSWISMGNFQMLMTIVAAGVLGANATIDAKFEQAKDDAGTDVKDLDGAAITQMTKADNDSNQAIIEFWSEDLDLQNGFTHVRLSMTVAGASSDSTAMVLGMGPRYSPASKFNLPSVVEIAQPA